MRAVRLIALLGIAFIAIDGPAALAQNYPSRPVRIIVPFAAGGTVDALARVLASKLSQEFGQSVLVENRPGAGGNLGADLVVKSPPDGHTILQNTVGQAIAPAIFRTLPFDVFKDFTPVTQLVATTLILVVNPNLPARSLGELIALAKSKPGGLNYGMSGAGNPLHLTMEMFKGATGTDILPVPYRGDAQIMNALITGEVQMAVVSLAIARPLIESGQVRALAVTIARRCSFIADIPTIGESVDWFEVSS